MIPAGNTHVLKSRHYRIILFATNYMAAFHYILQQYNVHAPYHDTRYRERNHVAFWCVMWTYIVNVHRYAIHWIKC